MAMVMSDVTEASILLTMVHYILPGSLTIQLLKTMFDSLLALKGNLCLLEDMFLKFLSPPFFFFLAVRENAHGGRPAGFEFRQMPYGANFQRQDLRRRKNTSASRWDASLGPGPGRGVPCVFFGKTVCDFLPRNMSYFARVVSKGKHLSLVFFQGTGSNGDLDKL